MKIVCGKESLIKVLNIAESIISTKNNISILSNVLIESKMSSLKISACETTISFFAEIGADIIEEGSISVYCNRFYTIVKKLDCEEIEISTDEKNIVTIKPKSSKKSIYNLNGISADKFPPVKPVEDIEFFSLNQQIFTEMTKKTIFSVAQTESRRFVSGVLFEKSDENIKMVSTDGKRLSLINKAKIINNIENCNIIIPPKILNEIVKICTGNGDIQLAINNKNIIIRIDNFYFISNLLEGEFPPYQRVIPTDQSNFFNVSRKELFDCIDRISTIGDKESHKVIFTISENSLMIHTENITLGSGEEFIFIEYSGPKIEMALNSQFINEMLSIITTDKVVFEFKDSQAPVTVKEFGHNDYIYVMLPMSLQG
ncbi:MAG TPA: DNA polymerase III subunit beta [Spirochaetota bacterium]|nr:DNA polymerase III subunit beta [Spirochaetota bacterium]